MNTHEQGRSSLLSCLLAVNTCFPLKSRVRLSDCSCSSTHCHCTQVLPLAAAKVALSGIYIDAALPAAQATVVRRKPVLPSYTAEVLASENQMLPT